MVRGAEDSRGFAEDCCVIDRYSSGFQKLGVGVGRGTRVRKGDVPMVWGLEFFLVADSQE